MPNIPPAYGIIPARYESTRFPGKPLAEILGRPMFWHVYQRAIQCPLLGKVVVATDDNRIYSEACRYNVPVVMTGREHASGTDRALEVAQMLGLPEDAVVVNVQGDEPMLEPAMLTELLEPFADQDIEVATLATKITREEAESPDHVKVLWALRLSHAHAQALRVPGRERAGAAGKTRTAAALGKRHTHLRGADHPPHLRRGSPRGHRHGRQTTLGDQINESVSRT